MSMCRVNTNVADPVLNKIDLMEIKKKAIFCCTEP